MALKALMDSLMSDDDDAMEGKMKATIVADDEEGLIEGAKQVPKALSKAEEYMKSRMSEMDEKPKKKK